MTKIKSKALALVLCAILALSATAIAFPSSTAHALDATSTVEYPYATGSNAFRYAPTFTMATEAGAGNNKWEYIEVKTDAGTVDVRSAKYFAIQIRVDKGDPGLTLGFIENGDRFNNCIDGNKMYFLSEDGTLTELSVLYSAINLGVSACGTLIMPVSQMGWQWNNSASDLSKVTAFYFTTNTQFNYDYALTIGSVGYWNGEPGATDTTFTVIADASKGERAKDKYYVDSANVDCMKFPSQAGQVEPTPPTIEYPFRKGHGANLYAASWQGPATGDSADNWQQLKIKFDTATVDFSSADYLVIQYYGALGTPGITYDLFCGDAAYSVGAGSVDGKPVYYMGENDETSAKTANITYGAVNASLATKIGAIIIPMTSMDWSYGAAANRNLKTIDTLILQTNSKYNYNFRIVVGEVGMYSEANGFTKLVDLSSKKNFASLYNSNGDNVSTLSYITYDRIMKGDASVDITGNLKKDSYFSEEGTGGNVLINGSYGSLEIVKDAYGEDAMKITATGKTGDGYTAVTLAEGMDINWGGMKGVSFYAKNESDSEVFFNLEIDCRLPNGQSARFNILQGNRFWLYDIKTGITSIYMTRPTATLPAGFEGWVRIPFSAFEKAVWSTGAVSKEEFMSEGSVVSYFAITIEAEKNMNKSFVLNNIGGYATTPKYTSAFVSAVGYTIPELMGLN